MVIMVGPHEDMSVTLWSTEQCLTLWFNATLRPVVTKALLRPCMCVCVCVYCSKVGWKAKERTKSFVTCGFTCLVLKLMTNLWSVSLCLSVCVHTCWLGCRWCHAWELLFLTLAQPAIPLRTFAACWHCMARSVCLCIRMHVASVFLLFFLDVCCRPRENISDQTSSYACHPPLWSPTLCVPVHKSWVSVCMYVLLFSVLKAQKFYLAGMLKSLRCKRDGRRV